jgi:HSP20 family protein
MSLAPRETFGGLTPLRDAMNRLFEESFLGPRFEFFGGRSFPLDVYETPDRQQYVVEAALPGYKPEEIEITAEGDTLNVRASRKSEEKVEKGNYVRREFYMGEMSRSITLPTPIDPNKVEASYEQGVLSVRIPKAQGSQPKQILIKTKETVSAS